MQFKPITAIIVLLLVVASLLVSGCTTSTTSNTNQTPSASATPSAATHDAFLEKFFAAYKDAQYLNKSHRITAYELEWINGTAGRIQNTYVWKPSNYTNNTEAQDYTYTVFPTSQDATTYLNTMNKTAYNLQSTICNSDSPLVTASQNASGHAPQICKKYRWNDEGGVAREILQVDNIILVGTAKIIYRD